MPPAPQSRSRRAKPDALASTKDELAIRRAAMQERVSQSRQRTLNPRPYTVPEGFSLSNYNLGTSGGGGGSITDQDLLGELNLGGRAKSAFFGLLDILDTPRSAVVATGHQLGLLGRNVLRGEDNPVGPEQWLDEVRGNITATEVFGEHLPDTHPAIKYPLGFALDVVADPLTYLAPETKLDDVNRVVGDVLEAGRAGRLSTEAAEEAARRAYAARTAAVLDDDVLEAIGARGGTYFNVPGTGSVGRALHVDRLVHRVLGHSDDYVRTLGDDAGRGLIQKRIGGRTAAQRRAAQVANAPLRAIRDSRIARKARSAGVSGGQEAHVLNLAVEAAKRGDARGFAEAFTLTRTMGRARGVARSFEQAQGQQLADLLARAHRAGMNQSDLFYAVSGSAEHVARLTAAHADAAAEVVAGLRGWLDNIPAAAREAAGDDVFNELFNFEVPRIIREELRTTKNGDRGTIVANALKRKYGSGVDQSNELLGHAIVRPEVHPQNWSETRQIKHILEVEGISETYFIDEADKAFTEYLGRASRQVGREYLGAEMRAAGYGIERWVEQTQDKVIARQRGYHRAQRGARAEEMRRGRLQAKLDEIRAVDQQAEDAEARLAAALRQLDDPEAYEAANAIAGFAAQRRLLSEAIRNQMDHLSDKIDSIEFLQDDELLRMAEKAEQLLAESRDIESNVNMLRAWGAKAQRELDELIEHTDTLINKPKLLEDALAAKQQAEDAVALLDATRLQMIDEIMRSAPADPRELYTLAQRTQRKARTLAERIRGHERDLDDARAAAVAARRAGDQEAFSEAADVMASLQAKLKRYRRELRAARVNANLLHFEVANLKRGLEDEVAQINRSFRTSYVEAKRSLEEASAELERIRATRPLDPTEEALAERLHDLQAQLGEHDAKGFFVNPETGEPLVFHGSKDFLDMTVPNPEPTKGILDRRLGVFFASQREVADHYVYGIAGDSMDFLQGTALSTEGVLHEVHLRMENPIVYPTDPTKAVLRELEMDPDPVLMGSGTVRPKGGPHLEGVGFSSFGAGIAEMYDNMLAVTLLGPRPPIRRIAREFARRAGLSTRLAEQILRAATDELVEMTAGELDALTHDSLRQALWVAMQDVEREALTHGRVSAVSYADLTPINPVDVPDGTPFPPVPGDDLDFYTSTNRLMLNLQGAFDAAYGEETATAFREFLRERGYDGIQTLYDDHQTWQFIPLDPAQIVAPADDLALRDLPREAARIEQRIWDRRASQINEIRNFVDEVGPGIVRSDMRAEAVRDRYLLNRSHIERLHEEIEAAQAPLRSRRAQMAVNELALRNSADRLYEEARRLRNQTTAAIHQEANTAASEALYYRSVAADLEADALATEAAIAASDARIMRWEDVRDRLLPSLDQPTTVTLDRLRDLMHDGYAAWGQNTLLKQDLVEAMQAIRRIDEGGLANFFRMYDRVMNLWKGYAVLTPGFHFRNLMGGLFNNWIAGTHGNAYRNYLRVARAYAKGEADSLPEDLRTYFEEFRRLGIGSGGQTAMEIQDNLTQGVSLNPANIRFAPLRASRHGAHVGGRLVMPGGEQVENFLRGAQYMDARMAGMSQDAAFHQVMKYHFDYEDLSAFDRQVARRIIPFYTWTRRTVPLMLEQLIRKPGRFNNYIQIREEMEWATEREALVPDWLDRQGAIRTPITQGGLAAALPFLGAPNPEDADNPLYMMPDLPMLTLAEVSDPGMLLGQLSPFIKTPIEMLAGKQLYSNIPFQNRYSEVPTIWQGVPGLVPALELLGRVRRGPDGSPYATDRTAYLVEQFLPVFGRMRRLYPSEDKYSERHMTTLLSIFFGVGARTNNERSQLGELYRARDRLQERRQQARDLGYVPEGESYDRSRLEELLDRIQAMETAS